MFAIECPRCGIRYLVDTSSIVELRNAENGPTARVRCPSGHLLTHVFTAPRRRAAVRCA